MNEFLNTYKAEDQGSPFKGNPLGDAYFSSVFNFAVSNAVSSFGSYWASQDAQKIIKEDTFNYIWNSFPDQRGDLLNIAIGTSQGSYNRVQSISRSFCEAFLQNLYSNIPANDNYDSNHLRTRLVPIVDPKFDYLSELHKYSLSEEDERVYSLWERVATQSSKDENLFDYLWSRVKREKGATDHKERIVKAAMGNSALSDTLIKKIAKSSPKRIKRAVVSILRDEIETQNRILRRAEASPETAEVEHIAEAKEKLDKLEARAMLFVGCTDYNVVESLIDCLSRDNLPWLMPSDSPHHWLCRKLSRLIENEEE